MPLIANFSLDVLKEEFGHIGIHLLETFSDGQTRWGTEPFEKGKKYTGSFTMASEYLRDRYHIFSVRAIVERLGKAEKLPALEERLFARINEGPAFEPPRRASSGR